MAECAFNRYLIASSHIICSCTSYVVWLTTLEMSTIPIGSERELIEHYFHKGFQYKEIFGLLEKCHSVSMNVRTLKQRLHSAGLKRRIGLDTNDLEHVKEMIHHESQRSPESPMVMVQCVILVGAGFPYQALIQAQLGISDNILRLRYHTNVPRNTVASLLREIDPHGVEVRKHRVFRRRSYTSLGRNFC